MNVSSELKAIGYNDAGSVMVVESTDKRHFCWEQPVRLSILKPGSDHVESITIDGVELIKAVKNALNH